ncbi:phosphotransferase [Actinophytocola sediminis]
MSGQLSASLGDEVWHDVGDAVRRHLVARFGVGPVRELRPRRAELRSENRWLCAARDGRPALFVKVYVRSDRGVVEQRAMAAMPAGLSTRLVGHGEAAGIRYSAFAWADLTEIATDAVFAEVSGDLLARMHNAPPPSAPLPTEPVTEESYADTVRTLARTVPDVYEQVAADLSGRRARGVVREADQVARDTQEVFLHGDLARRNTAVGDAGYLLLDLERASVGPAELDLNRVWGRELAPPANRRRFLDAYRQGRGLPSTWPNQALLRFAQLRCGVTTLVTARRRRDPEFAAEGHRLLRDVLG